LHSTECFQGEVEVATTKLQIINSTDQERPACTMQKKKKKKKKE